MSELLLLVLVNYHYGYCESYPTAEGAKADPLGANDAPRSGHLSMGVAGRRLDESARLTHKRQSTRHWPPTRALPLGAIELGRISLFVGRLCGARRPPIAACLKWSPCLGWEKVLKWWPAAAGV